MLAAFTVLCQVVNTISSASTAYQVGTACGRPSARTDANVAVIWPVFRNRQASAWLILCGIVCSVRWRWASAEIVAPKAGPGARTHRRARIDAGHGHSVGLGS